MEVDCRVISMNVTPYIEAVKEPIKSVSYHPKNPIKDRIKATRSVLFCKSKDIIGFLKLKQLL